ncbi:MAG: hypothetical protein DDT32_01318 [Syntrophomonadaceae bacterium]|nr:hypothetical protein [Bacillota bacterium]MBT9147559.1 hypothetical protein [Bacillota bacterium]
MCRVLLLDLGTPRDELSEPIGIETLASYTEASCPEIRLTLKSLEIDNVKISDIETVFAEEPFDIVGISTKIGAYERLSKAINGIHKYNRAIIVLGDILATFAYNDILDIFDNVICVRGEGEESMPEIVQRYTKYGRSLWNYLFDIPNLAYKYHGKTILTRRSVIDVRKARHAKRSLLRDILRQNGIAHLEASRGCIYSNCSFCGVNEKYNRTRWRPFELEYVIEELEVLSNAGSKSPYFTDEDFFGDDIDRVHEFCHKVIEGKKCSRINPHMNFYFNARVGSILGEGHGGIKESIYALNLLKQAGLREIFIGVESGCSEQIKRYKKITTAQENLAAIDILRRTNIDLDIGFIFFDPEATLADLRANIDLICKAGINKNYSRVIKKLRLEPLTKLGDSFLQSHPQARVDLDLICHQYEFEHEEVAEIHQKFYDWEVEDLDIIYNMQSFCRGEVVSEDERKEIKDIIACYRYLDIEYLNALITAYESSLYSNGYLDNITAEFKRGRNHFDSTLIDKVKWYDSSYRRCRSLV